MPRVKILKDYQPKEGWKPGEMVEITNPWSLIREGNAILVDVDGRELEKMEVLVQVRSIVNSKPVIDYIDQNISRHPQKEEILAKLREMGVLSSVREEIVENVQTLPVKNPIEEVQRPIPVITEEEVKAKVEELKRSAEIKKKS